MCESRFKTEHENHTQTVVGAASQKRKASMHQIVSNNAPTPHHHYNVRISVHHPPSLLSHTLHHLGSLPQSPAPLSVRALLTNSLTAGALEYTPRTPLRLPVPLPGGLLPRCAHLPKRASTCVCAVCTSVLEGCEGMAVLRGEWGGTHRLHLSGQSVHPRVLECVCVSHRAR